MWTTKLAYVSNAQFEDAELTELIGKMRSGAIAGMVVGDVQEMAALLDSRCNPVVTHPQYTARVAARQTIRGKGTSDPRNTIRPTIRGKGTSDPCNTIRPTIRGNPV